jgi:hypothetical protein
MEEEEEEGLSHRSAIIAARSSRSIISPIVVTKQNWAQKTDLKNQKSRKG